MAYKKGESGNLKGRPVGTTKKYLIERASAITETLDSVGCDPFLVLADIALNGRSEKIKCEAAAELAQYLTPKLKSVELSTKDDKGFNFYFNSQPPEQDDQKENIS